MDASSAPDPTGQPKGMDLTTATVEMLLAPEPSPGPPPEEPDHLQEAPRPARRRSARGVEPPPDMLGLDMEFALVAAALQDPCVFTLNPAPADFHDERLAALWGAGQTLVQAGRPCDAILLHDALQQGGQTVERAFIEHLEGLNRAPRNAPEYAARVSDFARRRRLFVELQAAAQMVRTANGAWSDDLARVTARIAKLASPQLPEHAARVTGWSAAELVAASFPEPQWAVPGVVPVGLSFLAGRPKVGKSWLALQFAVAKGTGGRVFDRRVEQGPALYLALEDNGRRLRDRVTKQGMPSSATLRFETSWPRLTDGGMGLIERAIDAENYKLVIIDTLGRAASGVDMDDYGDTTAILGSLQSLAMDRNMAILVVDHHRKGAQGIEDDPVDAIVGSTGKSGVADAILALTKQQGKPGARLQVRGREMEEMDLVLTWDAALCCWQCEGTSEELEMTGRRGQVLEILQAAYPEPMLGGEIAKAAEMQRANIQALLNDLVREGRITKEPKQGRDQPYRAINDYDEGY